MLKFICDPDNNNVQLSLHGNVADIVADFSICINNVYNQLAASVVPDQAEIFKSMVMDRFSNPDDIVWLKIPTEGIIITTPIKNE